MLHCVTSTRVMLRGGCRWEVEVEVEVEVHCVTSTRAMLHGGWQVGRWQVGGGIA